MSDDLKVQLINTLKKTVLIATDESVEDFITLLEKFIDSKVTVSSPFPSYEEILYGDEPQWEEEYEQYDQDDIEYESYMEARYGR